MGDVVLLARVAASLLVVLGLVVVTLRFAAPWLQRFGRPTGGRVVVTDIVPLDRLHRVAVVRIDDRELLVGFGGGSVHTLAELGPADLKPADVQSVVLAPSTTEQALS